MGLLLGWACGRSEDDLLDIQDLEEGVDLQLDRETTYTAPNGDAVIIFQPLGFRKLRHMVLGHQEGESYAPSLLGAEEIAFTGGKAAKEFYISGDRRFVIKVIKEEEGSAFLSTGAEYLGYLYEREARGEQSLLVKIFGIYRVKSKKLGSVHVIVQEHLWPRGTTMLRKFDIKGIVGRRQREDGSTGFEENLSDFTRGKPLLVSSSTKDCFDKSLARDLSFLEKTMYVLDYSLLLGVDQVNKNLVVGIVDYCRKFSTLLMLYGATLSKTIPKDGPPAYSARFLDYCHGTMLMGVVSG